MKLFSNGLLDWKQYWRGDLRASVSVAFIAIPLGLGIGLASGVPPLAAIIPCVVGGLIITWFGGGNVAVHSTPKMLIGVTAAGVLAFGGDDLFLGYRLFLSAVVVAGLIQFVLGLLRLGIIGDLIPATVIKSLLTAVGVIIIVKQIPVLMGVPINAKSVAEGLLQVPDILINENPIITFIGLLSVVIMFVQPKIEYPIVKAIPGAVWVILVAEFYSYSVGFEEGGTFNIIGIACSVNKGFLVNLPDQISSAIVYPDFSMWQTSLFWNTVLAVVVVSSIEGILSAKAIDRLDPLKRKSNVNKELSAIGLGTSVSGMLGGLPVIPAIVSSSVGINHNGKTQLLDVFQAVLILMLIVLLGSQLQHIPLAALAGILIHTGYKLVNPTEIRNIYRIGWDQVLIFSVTLLVTLAKDLILGISAGIILTLIIHIVRLRSVVKLFTILFRPNVVAYEEEDEAQTNHVSIKGYCNFLNYPQLKRALDVIPHDATIIVDLSLAEFIDHTVMEHLAEYEESHIRKGGEFEIIGLGAHLTSATHPLSVRFKGDANGLSISKPLTSRQQKLQSLAGELNWEFDSSVTLYSPEFDAYHLLQHKMIDRTYNRLQGTVNGHKVVIQDIDFHEGELQTKVNAQTTVAEIHLNNPAPLFTIEREYLFDKIAALAGYDDIDFEKFDEFSSNFKLKGENEAAVVDYFTDNLLNFMETELPYRVECIGNQIMLFGKERTMTVSEVKSLIEFSTRLSEVLPEH
jgi:MFS superfamily sulfate permease-like transporter